MPITTMLNNPRLDVSPDAPYDPLQAFRSRKPHRPSGLWRRPVGWLEVRHQGRLEGSR